MSVFGKMNVFLSSLNQIVLTLPGMLCGVMGIGCCSSSMYPQLQQQVAAAVIGTDESRETVLAGLRPLN